MSRTDAHPSGRLPDAFMTPGAASFVDFLSSYAPDLLPGRRALPPGSSVADLGAVHATTSADDVEDAKPDPGILEVALERAGARAEEALVVGDSVWDMRAAGRAGVRAIGLASGGVGPGELLDAGAEEVLADPAELLARLDAVLGARGTTGTKGTP